MASETSETPDPTEPVPLVLVVDDHEIVGLGVRAAFESRHVPAKVRWYRSVADIPTPIPDCIVVLDLRLDDDSTPAENLAVLEGHGLPVVIQTSADDPYLLRQAIASGAMAIVRKSAPPAELVDAVLAAARGEASAGLDWAAALDTDGDFVSTHLTPVEADVLAHYATGEKSETVARKLDLSPHSVNTYVARIREKYRSVGRPATSRVDLFRRAAEDGLISYFDDPRVPKA